MIKKTPIVLATNLHKCHGPDKNNWDINLNKSISFLYNFRKLWQPLRVTVTSSLCWTTLTGLYQKCCPQICSKWCTSMESGLFILIVSSAFAHCILCIWVKVARIAELILLLTNSILKYLSKILYYFLIYESHTEDLITCQMYMIYQ